MNRITSPKGTSMADEMITIPWCETCQSNHHSRPIACIPQLSIEDQTVLSVPPSGTADLVARRIILKRRRWDEILALTARLEAERGIKASPAEIAAIVLDAGIDVVTAQMNGTKDAVTGFGPKPRRKRKP